MLWCENDALLEVIWTLHAPGNLILFKLVKKFNFDFDS